MDLFENQGDGNIYNLFPDFNLNIKIGKDKYQKIPISTNTYGLCRAICRYFRMIIALNSTQSLHNLLYYLFGKLLYFKTKKLNDLFESVIRPQIFEAIYEFKNNSPHFEFLDIELSGLDLDKILDYVNIIAPDKLKHKDQEFKDDLWTETILGFYLFIFESYAVLILKLIKWCETNDYSDYPDFLKSLDEKLYLETDRPTKNIYDIDYYGYMKSCKDKGNQINKCLYDKLLKTEVPNTLTGPLKIIAGRKKLYDFSDILEELMPEVYSQLVDAGYDPKKDKPINNSVGGQINNHNLILKLLKLD